MVYPIQRQHQYTNNHYYPQMPIQKDGNGIQQSFKERFLSSSPIGSLVTKGFSDISGTLTNVDKVVKVVRSAAPIVQEYGPMIKNLPAMYKMVKALSQIEDENNVQERPGKEESKRQDVSGHSTPKLYI